MHNKLAANQHTLLCNCIERTDKPHLSNVSVPTADGTTQSIDKHQDTAHNCPDSMEDVTYVSLGSPSNSPCSSPQSSGSLKRLLAQIGTAQEPPKAVDTKVANLKAQLSRQYQVLEQLEVDRSQCRLDIQSLNARLDQMHSKITQRSEAQRQLEANYHEHLKSIRATPDDLTTIAHKLQDLKKKIRELAEDLVAQADPVEATSALRTFWLNLHDCIQRLGNPLPRHRLCMLTEKFMMDVLVQNMNLNVFPGLAVLAPYNDIALWLERQDDTTTFATRLRQEIALVMTTTTDTADHQAAVHANWTFLYGGLSKAYPFIYHFDTQHRNRQYAHKVQELVEQAMALGFAMKGQEVDVAAAETLEQVQVFDDTLMVDEDGQTDGIVDFCIYPPFVVYGSPAVTLEKGRVLCSASQKSHTRTAN